MKIAKYYDESNRLYAYFDLHAHTKFSGAFAFGNEHCEIEQRLNIRALPKIMSLYSECFDFEKFSKFKIKKKKELAS